MTPQKMLFCADFSANSEPARQLAIDYAKVFEAQLIVIHVIDSTAFEIYREWAVGEDVSPVMGRAQETVEKRLEQLHTECGRQVKPVCKVGLPAQEIVALARDESVDLIVIGTHGRTGVKHLVMGSIARSVLKMAHRPVLIVEGPSSGETSQGT